MRVVVTGGAGFIGATILGRLVDRNRVIIFDNFTRNSLKDRPFCDHKNLRVVNGRVRMA